MKRKFDEAMDEAIVTLGAVAELCAARGAEGCAFGTMMYGLIGHLSALLNRNGTCDMVNRATDDPIKASESVCENLYGLLLFLAWANEAADGAVLDRFKPALSRMAKGLGEIRRANQ